MNVDIVAELQYTHLSWCSQKSVKHMKKQDIIAFVATQRLGQSKLKAQQKLTLLMGALSRITRTALETKSVIASKSSANPTAYLMLDNCFKPWHL